MNLSLTASEDAYFKNKERTDGRYTSDEIKNAPAQTADVGYENTLITFNNMTIDFGDGNFDEGEEWKFTVRELPADFCKNLV